MQKHHFKTVSQVKTQKSANIVMHTVNSNELTDHCQINFLLKNYEHNRNENKMFYHLDFQ